MVRGACLEKLAVALLGAAAVAFSHAQAPQAPATESQARYWVYGAFLTQAVPEIMSERVALGPELGQRLGLSSGADRSRVYGALMSYTDGKPLRVRSATANEIARYKPQAKRELKTPVFAVQAGDIALLVEYDMQTNTIPFVGQLDVAYQPRVAPAVPVAIVAPNPAAARVPPPPPAEALKPNGPCTVKPVMSEQDLANCRAAPGGSVRVQSAPPATPVVVKPQAPVVVKPQAPVVVKPQARAAPPPAPQRTGPCEVKPVMTEQDLANCRVASGGAARAQPVPPAVVKPLARIEPAPHPQRAAPCEVKPVMTEEDLAACRNAPAGTARVQPAPALTARPAAPPEPPHRPAAAPCVVKPVMSEEDLVACGIRSR
jgi:hypothetical protein